jgi:hypothetical protein
VLLTWSAERLVRVVTVDIDADIVEGTRARPADAGADVSRWCVQTAARLLAASPYDGIVLSVDTADPARSVPRLISGRASEV